MGWLLIVVHAISMTLALAVFTSIYRNNPVKGKWFLSTILICGLFSLYRLFNFSLILGVGTVLMYVLFTMITIRTLKKSKPAA
ncbi:hypothetical protein [Bacillus sp. Marseille-Q1617]|uniref:hypothetical protein n=1 Tax=Bacillus sp. Marseille-Q1617 TaxID=2736887 RepID=UPI00158C0E97|nr:hypothetical protein [Bacillus sp. Marseille-Q1617]